MDALHPRLLVDGPGFAATFAFYDAVLPELVGAVLRRGTAAGPYANWDVGDEGVLVLFDRGAMAAAIGDGAPTAAPTAAPTGPAAPTAPTAAPASPAQDTAMFVCRVADVDAGLALCLKHGATLVAAAADRPDWGPTLRTAHVRDPYGTLIELQSYASAL